MVGLGIAACAACCAPAIVGFLAAAGIATSTAVLAFGAIGLLALVPLAVMFHRRRRRIHVGSCATNTEAAPVAITPRPADKIGH